ncbi:MAG: hypothetical protein IAG13_26630 [Deltaproteobacteria bacterium]|nr:hypothetical protein [Nannocystaceae bacterium]
MAYTRATTRPTSPLLAAPIGALILGLAGDADAATPTYYDNQDDFTSDIMESVTDDYSNPGYVFIQNNAMMSAVIGETDYFTTGFDDLNIVSGGYYCAGCNGSFELSFQSTSVGEPEGVNGVGLNIVTNDFGTPYFAFITFADGTTADILLGPGGNYWGVSAPERIERIHFGLSGGVPTMAGGFGIDDLTIGDGMDETPCGDGMAEDDEECDDAGESPSCDADCTLAVCGDGTFNFTAGELCDDGGPSASCNVDCTAPVCGDTVVNLAAGETCDEGGETVTCDSDCTAVMCGDNVANVLAGEECDDSAQSPECDGDCTFVVCGDGIENNVAGEYCDDGNLVDGDGCSAKCTVDEVEGSSSEGGSSEDTGGSDTGSDSGESTDGTLATGDTGDTGDTAAESSDGGSQVDTSGDDSGSASLTTTEGATESGGGESSGDGSASAGGNDDGSGCSCSTDAPGRGAAWSMLGLLGLGAMKRRGRRR